MKSLSLTLISGAALCMTAFQCSSTPETLESRFSRLSCAVVQIATTGGAGTGFFVNAAGRVVTAAHVLYQRRWYLDSSEKEIYAPSPFQDVIVTTQDNTKFPVITTKPTEADKKIGHFDLAVLETNHHTSCFIDIGDSEKLKTGQHLIAIGFPSVAPSAVLYDGFLSARHLWPVPMG